MIKSKKNFQTKENALDDLEKHTNGNNMNPVQIAAHYESSESLVVILRHIQKLCDKDTQGKLRSKIAKIIHVKASNKSLMSTVLESKQLFAAYSILHQIEDYIHKGNSIDIQKCILHQMGSSKLSKTTVDSMKKLHPKPKSCIQKTTLFITVFLILLPLKITPITFDVVTDSLLVKSLNTNSNRMDDLYNSGFILLINFMDGLCSILVVLFSFIQHKMIGANYQKQ